MTPGFRKLAFVLFAGLALVVAGCGSNNKGKIEGRWKVTTFPEKTDAKTKNEMDQLGKMGLYLFLEFKSDGTMSVGLGADKKEVLDVIKAMAPQQKTTWDMKYKLLSGDGVEVYDMPADLQSGGGGLFGKKDRARVSIKINGDDMTLVDDEGTTKLTKVK
jgi:hypothetical protein